MQNGCCAAALDAPVCILLLVDSSPEATLQPLSCVERDVPWFLMESPFLQSAGALVPLLYKHHDELSSPLGSESV